MLFAYLPAVFNVAIYLLCTHRYYLRHWPVFWAQFWVPFVVQQRWDIDSYYLHLPFSIMFVSASYLCCDSFLLLCWCLLLLLKFLLAMVITVIIISMGMNQLFSAGTSVDKFQMNCSLCSEVSCHWLFVSIYHYMLFLLVWFLRCKIVSVSIFVHCAHFYGINPLHQLCFFAFVRCFTTFNP